MNNDISSHLWTLLSRLSYMERRTEEFGPDRNRLRETQALTWALEELAEQFPTEYRDAEASHLRTQERRSRATQLTKDAFHDRGRR